MMKPDFTPSIGKQIACVEREIAMRELVYPRLIKAGRMKPGTAAREIGLMKAVRASLRGMLAPTFLWKGKAIDNLTPDERVEMLDWIAGAHPASRWSVMKGEFACPRCGKPISIMLPPSDAELATCGQCAVDHWVTESTAGNVYHVPPRERFKVGAR